MPHDPDLADRMRAVLRSRRGITEKRMFGGLCWLQHGNMLCGLETRRWMFRVGADRHDEAMRRPGAQVMDFTGRPMRGFVWVAADDTDTKALRDWVAYAAKFVATLPPK